jgi:hypothetical protein
MTNLTLLQEVALRILTAKIEGKNANPDVHSIYYDVLLESSIADARKFLEATSTKPEPLNWHKQSETEHHSGVENFTISEFNTGINGAPLPNIEYQLRNDGKLIGYFFDLDLAKEFIEHIRTR